MTLPVERIDRLRPPIHLYDVQVREEIRRAVGDQQHLADALFLYQDVVKKDLDHWGTSRTPYHNLPSVSSEEEEGKGSEFYRRLVSMAKKRNARTPLRVLDAGGYRGLQILDFFKIHPELEGKIQFTVTSATLPDFEKQEIQELVNRFGVKFAACRGIRMHANKTVIEGAGREGYDLALIANGFFTEIFSAVEAAFSMVRRGGEVHFNAPATHRRNYGRDINGEFDPKLPGVKYRQYIGAPYQQVHILTRSK